MDSKTIEFFRFKCKKGLESNLSRVKYIADKKKYEQRLQEEIEVIIKMGFPSYFLIVQDYINWARKNNIAVGPGRGSAAGSLVAWALGITSLIADPIKYNLYFERFLNEGRTNSAPDVDADFSKERRPEILQYLISKYGQDKVAQIGTWGTFKAKKSIRDVCRTLGYPLSISDKMSALYPKPEHGKEVKLLDAIKHVTEFFNWFDDPNSPEGEILRWALKMEGRIASYGVHASGVVISDRPITELIPLGKGRHDEVATQWDMINVEERGLVKFDILGLKNLSTISLALQFIKKNHGIDIDIESIPLDDQETYKFLQKGECVGVFQLEASSGIRDMAVKVRPEKLEDLAAICAIYRPGPLESPKLEAYLKWRSGEEQPEYPHKDLEPILSDTGSWIIYQEQCMRIARDICGFSLVEADNLRKAIGKKKKEEMDKIRDKFISGGIKRGYSSTLITGLFEEIEGFAAYSFNLSHALCYGILAYQTAWLRTHYPVEFFAAALSTDAGNIDQMIIYLQEAKRLNISVLPPDINTSDLDFTPTPEGIRFGLGAIKNVGNSAIKIVAERKKNKFESFWDLPRRIPILNTKVLEALVYSGVFDFTHQTRATLLLAITQMSAYKEDLKKYYSDIEKYKKNLEKYEQREVEVKAGARSSVGNLLKPLMVPIQPTGPKVPEYKETAELSQRDRLLMEKELLGFFISGHPLAGLPNTGGIRKLKEDIERPEQVMFTCIISEIEIKETKQNKKRMALLTLEDLSGVLNAAILTKEYDKYKDLLVPNVPLSIGANVKYTDVEGETEDVTLISLVVKQVRPVMIKQEKASLSEINIPLEKKYLKAIERAYKKAEPGDIQIKLNFITSSGTKISTILGVTNDRIFKSEIYRL